MKHDTHTLQQFALQSSFVVASAVSSAFLWQACTATTQQTTVNDIQTLYAVPVVPLSFTGYPTAHATAVPRDGSLWSRCLGCTLYAITRPVGSSRHSRAGGRAGARCPRAIARSQHSSDKPHRWVPSIPTQACTSRYSSMSGCARTAGCRSCRRFLMLRAPALSSSRASTISISSPVSPAEPTGSNAVAPVAPWAP